MNAAYVYLLLGCSKSAEELSVRVSVEEAIRSVFGECGAAAVLLDVLSVRDQRALLRVQPQHLRKLQSALTLHSDLRVLAHSSSLQALL